MFTSRLKFMLLCLFCWVLVSWQPAGGIEETTSAIQSILSKHHDPGAELSTLKKVELNVTNTGFCRYRKTFANGKVEYFAFNVSKFKDLDYLGTTTSGQLLLHTTSDDVIIQTYNDKKGDLDSMGTFMMIPLKDMEIEELNQLHDQFLQLKKAIKSIAN